MFPFPWTVYSISDSSIEFKSQLNLKEILKLCFKKFVFTFEIEIERCCITLITQINYYRYVSLHSNSFPLWAASLLPFSSHLFSCLSFSSSPFSSSLSSQHSSSSWPARTSGRGTYSLLARLVVVVVLLLILWDWGNKIMCKTKSWLDEHQPGHRVEGGADIHCCLLLAHQTAKKQI